METVKEVLDTKKKKSNWGGRREGSGRPEGAESQATKDKKIVKEQMIQRIMRSKDALLNSQMNLARGCQFLFVIETKKFKKDGVWKEEKQKPRIVEDQHTIEKYLAGELDNEDNEYYFMTTQKPDNKAIDSMFDRAFDKARQTMGLDGGEEGKPISLEVKREANKIIEDYLNENPKDITIRQQGDDKSSVSVQQGEYKPRG